MNSGQFWLINRWQQDTFPNATALSKLHHLKQEVEELIEAVESNDPEKRLEFADCFLLLFGAARSEEMTYSDIEKCIQEKHMININRNWGEPDENGVVKHIK